MMEEHEFDRKIRDSALRHESGIEKPLWDKKGVWNHIDSELEKKNRSIGWKAAAMILILLSAGWSFALWNNFRQYKHEKEMELIMLKQQLDQSIGSQKDNIYEEQIVIRRQNQELDSLKKQILLLEEANREKEFRKQLPVKVEVAENWGKPTDQENLVDSLQNQLRLAQKILANIELARLSEEKTPAKPEITLVPREVVPERRIYYISNQFTTPNPKKGKGFKIGILGFQQDENIEYQSNYSIFNNSQP